jgi:hypothetical protein
VKGAEGGDRKWDRERVGMEGLHLHSGKKLTVSSLNNSIIKTWKLLENNDLLFNAIPNA